MHRVGVVGVGEGLKAEDNRIPSSSRIWRVCLDCLSE